MINNITSEELSYDYHFGLSVSRMYHLHNWGRNDILYVMHVPLISEELKCSAARKEVGIKSRKECLVFPSSVFIYRNSTAMDSFDRQIFVADEICEIR